MHYQKINQRNSAFSRQFRYRIGNALNDLLSTVRQRNFQRFLFIQEVTVLLKKLKKILINAVKLILIFLPWNRV